MISGHVINCGVLSIFIMLCVSVLKTVHFHPVMYGQSNALTTIVRLILIHSKFVIHMLHKN